VPGFVGSALDPLIGAAGDTARRRALVLLGGLVFAASAGLTAGAIGFWTLLAAFTLGNPASGAFVSLAQATLMDLEPDARERNMARWTLAGSFGYVGGPVVIAAAIWLGAGWRAVLAALAIATVPLALASRRLPRPRDADGRTLRESLRHTVGALRRLEVVRWLALLVAADLLLDVFHGFLALYLVDVAGVSAVIAALGVGVWTGAGLVGDWLLLAVLRRVAGRRYLRWSAAAALVVYPAFLLVPGTAAKLALAALLGLLNSGWYAIPKAGLYASLPGRSGVAVAAGGVGGFVGAGVPLALGFLAGGVGLAATMWLLLLAPAALLALVPPGRGLQSDA
jgi:FSR family fosmidomycin resistance protein-like MFS transporter